MPRGPDHEDLRPWIGDGRAITTCRGSAFDLIFLLGEAAQAHGLPLWGVPRRNMEETIMAWTTPTLVEICIGLEINGYLPAEF